MSRTVSIIWLLLAVSSAQGQVTVEEQFAAAEKESDWIDLFDGATIKDCRVEGVHTVKDGLLVVGGATRSTLSVDLQRGQPFKILIEYRPDGLGPMLRTEHREFLGGGSSGTSLYGQVGEWTEVLLIGDADQQRHPGVRVFHREAAKHGVAGSTSLGGMGTVKVTLETPPGTTLSIRRFSLQAKRPTDSSGGLAIALIVLVCVLLAILVLGWLLHRRKPSGERM
jgi:hypothetical protein